MVFSKNFNALKEVNTWERVFKDYTILRKKIQFITDLSHLSVNLPFEKLNLLSFVASAAGAGNEGGFGGIC